jgi:hypothetical protein
MVIRLHVLREREPLLSDPVQSARFPVIPLLSCAMGVAATLALTSPAAAQQVRPGEQLGARYLSWAGKPAAQSGVDLRGPNGVAPHPQQATAVAASTTPGRPNRYGSTTPAYGLTPASAWIGRPAAVQPALPAEQPYAPTRTPMPLQRQAQTATQDQPQYQPQVQPQPQVQTASAPEYDAGQSFRRQAPYYAAPPQVQMAMQPTPQPTYMPPPVVVPAAAEPATASAAYDPMAPRADAPIFRMGRSAPAEQQPPEPQSFQSEAPQSQAQAAPHLLAQAAPTRPGQPAREGARYYSVHREAGHEPDPVVLPESIFIGGGASADLAEPPPAPVTTRTINGRQVLIQNEDPSLP